MGAVFVGTAAHRLDAGAAGLGALVADARASLHFGPRRAAGFGTPPTGPLAMGTGLDTAIEIVMFVHFALP